MAEQIETSLQMANNAEMYHDNNELTRHDAIQSLNEFSPKFTWKPNERVIEIGCADGSITNILTTYLPKNIHSLTACDKDMAGLKYANEHYKLDKVTYRYIDIEEELLDEDKGKYGHLFSLCTFHWIRNQQKAFQNVYDLLENGGECFLTLFAYGQMYHFHVILKDSKKWAPWLQKHMTTFISPYYNVSSPDKVIEEMLKKIGFIHVEIKTRQKTYTYQKQEFRDIMKAINPFKIPTEKIEDFIDDLLEVVRGMGLVNDDGTISGTYVLLIVYCRK